MKYVYNNNNYVLFNLVHRKFLRLLWRHRMPRGFATVVQVVQLSQYECIWEKHPAGWAHWQRYSPGNDHLLPSPTQFGKQSKINRNAATPQLWEKRPLRSVKNKQDKQTLSRRWTCWTCWNSQWESLPCFQPIQVYKSDTHAKKTYPVHFSHFPFRDEATILIIVIIHLETKKTFALTHTSI